MAQVTITFPDAVAPRVLDAYAAAKGWTAASGLTKAQFMKADLLLYIKDTVRRQEGSAAGQTAQDAARAKVDSEIVLS